MESFSACSVFGLTSAVEHGGIRVLDDATGLHITKLNQLIVGAV